MTRLQDWITAVLNRPSVVATATPQDEMLDGMRRMLERMMNVAAAESSTQK